MSYEIPQELEYKEKIVFGLTFEQLSYLLIFISPVLLIFLKTALALSLKIMFSTFFMVLAFGFMFLKFKQKLLDILSWMKFRNYHVASLKMKNFIPIYSIEEKTIVLKKFLEHERRKTQKDLSIENKTY